MHCLWKVYKAGGFRYYPPASVSQDCLCLHPISLTCSSLSFSSLLLLSSTLYLCYPLCQLSSLLISLSLSLLVSLSLSVLSGLVCPDWNIVCRVETLLFCALCSWFSRLKHCLQSWNITHRVETSLFLVVLSLVQSCHDNNKAIEHRDRERRS